MATKIHQQAFGNYPENIDKREARVLACGYSLLQVAATETYAMDTGDSFTHATIAGTSGTTILKLPLAAASLGRVLNIYVSDTTGTVNLQTSTGSTVVADMAAGPSSWFCNGTTWVQVG